MSFQLFLETNNNKQENQIQTLRAPEENFHQHKICSNEKCFLKWEFESVFSGKQNIFAKIVVLTKKKAENVVECKTHYYSIFFVL